MSLDTHALAPRYGSGTRWWPDTALVRSRLAGPDRWLSPPCSHRHGRRPWSTFAWHWAVMAALLVPSLGAVRLFGAVDRQAGLAALAAVTLVSLLRTLLDAEPVRRPTARMPPDQAGAVACPVAAEGAAAPAPAEAPLTTCKEFDDAVRRALSHLGDPTRLAASPLLRLALVGAELRRCGLQDTRLNRGAMLKAVLTELLEGLQPPRRSCSVVGESRRFYNCLYYPYVQGVSRRRGPSVLRQLQERRLGEGGEPSEAEQVVAWLLQVDEDTYYKWQRRGSDALAGALREREAAAGGAVPEEGRARRAIGKAS